MLRKKNYVYGAEVAYLPHHLHFGQYMLEKCKLYMDEIALLDAATGAQVTYGEVAEVAAGVALSLAGMGLGRGDVVSVCSEKRSEFIPTMIGIMCSGATFMPADVSCMNDSILHRLSNPEPRVIFCSPSVYKVHKKTFKLVNNLASTVVYGDSVVEDAILFKDFVTKHVNLEDFIPMPVTGWSDLAVILYSSGTTGLPKGAKFTHLSFLMCFQHGLAAKNLVGARMFSTRDWYYTYGLKHTIGTLMVGATVVFTTSDDVKDILRIIQEYKRNPSAAHHGERDGENESRRVRRQLTHVHDVYQHAYRCRTVKRCDEEIYGMTEAGCLTDDLNSAMGPKAGSVGCANPGVVIKIVDLKTRQPLGANEIGELCFKSLSLMSGYVGETTRDYLDEEGFFKSGDVGYYDEDRYFYIVDRLKDLIKYRGATVSPAEVEAALLRHPAVKDAGVVGMPHPDHCEVPAAFVVAQPGAAVTERDLVAFIGQQLSTIKMEGGIRFLKQLPRGATSKLSKKSLREML
ncbi:unnamed protein product, partial [Iphiclides podalirius]